MRVRALGRPKSFFFIALFVGLVLLSLIPVGRADTVELHAHLFMKQGMNWGFHGDFFGPLQAHSWKDRLSSQANPESLEKSGLSIVVCALYAHPLFTYTVGESPREAIREQIRLARKFVMSRPDWVIATGALEARDALASGKHVMILALEGASGILESEQDLREFIDEGGIRIVTPLHLTDDEFGGVAFLHGWEVLSNPWAWLTQLGPWGAGLNQHGLTDAGRALIQRLLDRRVWIDLAHASDESLSQMIPMIERAGQPLLYTHTVLREYLHAERGVTRELLSQIARSGGLVGLMPSENMLVGAPASASCHSALYGLAQEYKEIAGIFAAAGQGAESIMMGSDYNGGVEHLRPAGPGCRTGTSLDTQGLWNIGQVPDLWKALSVMGAPAPSPLSKMTDKFIASWARVRGAP